ncbi:MAG TPA: cell division protein FtsZ [Candidatus Hydrogenedentes bacterium]|nr:cell division protein FtsZ [Candidatus Hydrogenedentota bacterium]HQM99990.1 cell division protein FtsZ [Candidatus Hydrogenedentota bacterium]
MLIEHSNESMLQDAIIKVCGVGGAGGNAVNRMIESGMTNVDFIAINTDVMDLRHSLATTRLQIGQGKGVGAGARPEIGRQACEEDRESVRNVVQGAEMVFLTAGLGGGTGTGASPIVAEEATASGALVVAVVTLPFSYEGMERMDNALSGLEELEKHVDSMIVVPNDRIAQLSDDETRLVDAFRKGDEVLHNGVRAISELITVPGLINVDFADVRTLMKSRGRALMGIGVCEGQDRAIRAAKDAINCPLLEQSDICGAKGVIINIRGGNDMRMQEVMKANEYIKSNIGREATIIGGAVVDEEERPEIQITVIAAGFEKKDPTEYTARFVQADNISRVSRPVAITVREKEEEAPVPIPVEKPVPVKAPVEDVPAMTAKSEETDHGKLESAPSIAPATSYTPLSSAGRANSQMPPYLQKVLEKKRQAYENTLSKTPPTRRST